jgi:hypothetical protein
LNVHKVTIPTLLAIGLVATLIPSLVHSTGVPIPPQRPTPTPIYGQLSSRIDTVPSPNPYSVLTVTFSLNTDVSATIFLSVGTFVKPSQCCPGGYVEYYSIDNGTPIAVCGGETSQFTGVLVTITCFSRTSFTAGQHSVTLLVSNGGGTWTIEATPPTSMLITFD